MLIINQRDSFLNNEHEKIVQEFLKVVAFGENFIKELLPVEKFQEVGVSVNDYRAFISYNPISQKVLFDVEKFLNMFASKFESAELLWVLFVITAHELGHHLQILMNRNINDTNKEWRENTADYFSGFVLGEYCGKNLNSDFLDKINFAGFENDFEKTIGGEYGVDNQEQFNHNKVEMIKKGLVESGDKGKLVDFFGRSNFPL